MSRPGAALFLQDGDRAHASARRQPDAFGVVAARGEQRGGDCGAGGLGHRHQQPRHCAHQDVSGEALRGSGAETGAHHYGV